MNDSYAAIGQAVAEYGMLPRGGFYPHAGDDLPRLTDRHRVQTVVLIGNAGSSLFACFDAQNHGAGENPLDDWVKARTEPLARMLDGRAVYPSDGPPYWPFQAWARRAQSVWPSPLGMLMHPGYGLWHAYRAALLLPARIDIPAPEQSANPCEDCAEKPCLHSCPAHAFGSAGYAVERCASYLGKAAAEHDCLTRACRARRACPVGRPYQYQSNQARFHMHAFLRNRPLSSAEVSGDHVS